jgi:hypothetical protein
VVLGRIEEVRAEELPPCPEAEADAQAVQSRCGPVLVAEVRPTEFLRGQRQERLTVRFPRLLEERELAGTHAALFLEKHGEWLWIAEGRAGLVASREPFVALGVDRLRLALALEKEQGGTTGEDAPLMVNPRRACRSRPSSPRSGPNTRRWRGRSAPRGRSCSAR